MIQDIQLLAKIRDRAFINKVLLPLIENEVTIPISLYETDLDIITGKSEASASADDAGEDVTAKSSWQPDFDALSCGTEVKEKKEVIDYSKNFLPTSILDADQKQYLFKAYKEILGN